MKRCLVILLCKLLRSVLKALGRGSSMPGKIALKLYPDILSKIKMPKYIIAVTGSNGKTSTVEMIHEVLDKANISYAYNSEGSNQIDGVATLVLNNCNCRGEFNKDVLLLESDERYAQYSFKYFSPTHYVITNLYRDQMTRNGNPEFVLGEIKKSIHPESTLILNSDDPLISSLACKDNDTVYFGIDDTSNVSKENDFVYDDGRYCPVCKSRLIYDYHQFGHVGKYHCSSCDFERKQPAFSVTDINLDEYHITVNNKYNIKLAFNSIYNVYNILSAFSVCSLIGINPDVIVEALNSYLVKNGRVKNFELGKAKGTLLISKHENSVSYNQNIRYVVDCKKDVTVVLIVDAISRKYFTSETSWLWDINFELLKSDNVKRIIISGLYASDVATRLQFAGIDFDKVYINKSIPETVNYLRENNENYIYTLTCFSDENKFTREVTLL